MSVQRMDLPDHQQLILIVDDEPRNRELLKAMLTPDGFLFRIAASGAEALASIAEQHPDLVLLDIMMPDMDGHEVVVAIKGDAATSHIPIIMVTALDDRKARLATLDAGAEDFLTKPIDRAELRVRVRNLLRLKALSDHFSNYSKSLESEVRARTRDLVASEERMRFALVNANVGIWDVDPDGSIRWSDTLEAQYGMPPGTFPGTQAAFLAAVHPDDRADVIETMTRAARAGGDFTLQHRTLHPDGSTHWLDGSGHYQLDDAGKPLRAVGISQDITVRRTLERQYQQSQKMEAVGKLASGVAHDFNNLLTVITGFAEFVSASLPDDSQSGDDVAEIIKAADRAAALTHQLLAFSRQQVLHMAPVNVNELVTDMNAMITRLIGEDISVRLALQPSVCVAIADRGQIEQVLMNLVVNARDAMPRGGSIVIETAEVELENSPFHEEHVEAGHYVMLAVTDTGTGMSMETQKRLFEPFYTTKGVGEGTGLGLSTSYGIVKQSNGHLWVYSEPGSGTTFKIYLPRSCDEVPVSVAVSPPVPAAWITETLLLVEDESSVRDLATRILCEAGYRVLRAANGADAQSLFNRHQSSIDLVLTDVVMPGVGGPELLAHLHQVSPKLPVLYMSGYTEQSVAARAGLDRGIPFLQKPFTSAELLRGVRSVLEGACSPTGQGSPL